jgi:hypothetical protein
MTREHLTTKSAKDHCMREKQNCCRTLKPADWPSIWNPQRQCEWMIDNFNVRHFSPGELLPFRSLPGVSRPPIVPGSDEPFNKELNFSIGILTSLLIPSFTASLFQETVTVTKPHRIRTRVSRVGSYPLDWHKVDSDAITTNFPSMSRILTSRQAEELCVHALVETL